MIRFILDETKLAYYPNEEKKKALGVIEVDALATLQKTDKGRSHHICK
jgi:hypothetical protein